ncbi:hypothetical protein QR680_000229 [Steinernema hermaphroditum]|uniref:Uncharacterized protein n=1 Tax=Steinernema hermaphroditum TaxID=289476 RepID=A0AA39GTW0_9BILA|nr:hypothetical protein QR680_000229 [Steinernema hermaphroditum]
MFRLLARCSLNTQAHRINSLLKFPVVTEEILMFYERCQLTPSQMDSMHWLISYYLYVASVHESLNRMFHYFYFGHGELIPSRFKTLFIQCAWKHFEQFLHASKNQLLSLLVMLNDVELSTRQEDLKLLDTVAISHGHLPIDRLDFPYYEGALPGIGYIWKDISMVKTNRRVPREIKRGRCVFKILVDPLPEKVYRVLVSSLVAHADRLRGNVGHSLGTGFATKRAFEDQRQWRHSQQLKHVKRLDIQQLHPDWFYSRATSEQR